MRTCRPHGKPVNDDANDRPCSKTVLIVEDDDDIREGLRIVLEDEGYFVEVAGNGLEAIDRLENMPRPCVVLLDMNMPVMDGYEFLRATQSGKAASIPVTVVAAGPVRGPTRARRVFQKPVALGMLLEAVDEACLSRAAD